MKSLFLAGLAVSAVLAALFFGSRLGADPQASRRAAPAASSNWVTHEDPAGFRIQHPPGWSVQARPGSTVVVRSGDGSAMALVRPVFGNGGGALGLLSRASWLDAELLAGARLDSAVPLSRQPDQARAVISYASGRGPGRAVALCTMFGATGMVFAIAAPESEFDRHRETLVRILQSFSFAGARAGSASPGAPQIQYTRFQDPREGSFSLDVPAGWKVDGGLVRLSPTDLRGFLHAQSPEGVFVGLGDPNIPPFVVPNEMHLVTGFSEGSWYQLADGSRLMVRSYVPGLAFAQEYVASALGRGGGLEILDQRERPELAQAVRNAFGQLDNAYFSSTLTFGEVSFRLARSGQTLAGFCLAGPELHTAMGTGIWYVRHLYVTLAPEGRTALASAVMERMLKSYEVNPQWFASQLRLTGNVSRIVSETHDYVSRVQSESYWNRQQVLDRTSQRFSDSIRGIQRVQDPNTGQVYEAVAGSNYYWRAAGSDRPFGTETSDVPRYIDVTPLLKID
jgi:hypothetical protein